MNLPISFPFLFANLIFFLLCSNFSGSIVPCPESKSISCQDGFTCCKSQIHFETVLYCCPHKNAVCCGGFSFTCCPNGTLCDANGQKCLKSNFGAIHPFIPAIPLQKGIQSQ